MIQKDRKYWRDWVSNHIKAGAVDAALVSISQGWSLVNRGPIKWITERLLEYLWDKTADKVLKAAMRKGWLAVDLVNGSIKVKKINKAKNENDPDTYWDTISDI